MYEVGSGRSWEKNGGLDCLSGALFEQQFPSATLLCT